MVVVWLFPMFLKPLVEAITIMEEALVVMAIVAQPLQASREHNPYSIPARAATATERL